MKYFIYTKPLTLNGHGIVGAKKCYFKRQTKFISVFRNIIMRMNSLQQRSEIDYRLFELFFFR